MKGAGEEILLLGAGGMGMLPLARYLHEGGARVTGYDDALSAEAARFYHALGRPLLGPGEAPPPCHRWIRSSAIRPDHPWLERVRARSPEAGGWRRGEWLAELARDKRLLAVAGSHGKTSTTALLAFLAERAGSAWDYLVGGLPLGGWAPARCRGGEWLVAEIDESDGTMEAFAPEITVFLHFDWDHAARYARPEDLREAWARLAARTENTVLLPAEGTAGEEPSWPEGVRLERFPAEPDGFRQTNRRAAEAAYRAATGEPAPTGWSGNFPGIWRRQDWHYRGEDRAVVEDYAHHPRELAAVLRWLRAAGGPSPLRVFFQAHRYSRTRHLAGELAAALAGADEVWLFPVYPADEKGADDPEEVLALLEEAVAAAAPYAGRVSRREEFPGCGGGGGSPAPGTWAFLGAGDSHAWAPVLAALAGTGGDRERAMAHWSREHLLPLGLDVREHYPLEGLTTFRVGGPARFYAEPADVPALATALRGAARLGIPVAQLGRGSNVLVPDEGFPGLVLRLVGPAWEGVQDAEDGAGRFRVGAGCPLQRLARWAAREGWAGFEFLEGIPGSVGGGLRMNAGAMGHWMEERVVRVETLSPEGEPEEWPREALAFGYRSCPQLEGRTILRAVLEAAGREDPAAIRERMRQMAGERRARQPGGPSAGCVFRNPEGASAGACIEGAGLKGLRQGGVRVSDQHANFFLTSPGARAAEVLSLVRLVRERVADHSGVWLEPEVRLLGGHWDPGDREAPAGRCTP